VNIIEKRLYETVLSFVKESFLYCTVQPFLECNPHTTHAPFSLSLTQIVAESFFHSRQNYGLHKLRILPGGGGMSAFAP
jgi:hypothetical protein